MTDDADVLHHIVIAIYGVGNPAPGDIERAVSANLGAVLAGVPLEVHEFDWNTVAAHAPRTEGRLWHYAGWFSESLVAAAWCRSARSNGLDRARNGTDAVLHCVWAATQAAFVVLSIAAVALYVVGEASRWLADWVHALTMSGMIPAGIGWRSAVVSQHALALGVGAFRYGSYATVALMAASLAMATVQAGLGRSFRPLAVAARRLALIVLLAPCVLLSLVAFPRDDSKPLWSWEQLGVMAMMIGIGLVMMTVLSVFMGSARQTLAWYIVGPGIFLTIALVGLVIGYFRGRVGRAWLVSAKVLLDIALYVGSSSYRTAIQDGLSRLVLAIPERSRARIWLVAHSLGSVIALDSLTNSSAWTSGDRVRLVTLGSPARRFFMRFFPGLYFEPDIDRAARVAAARVGEFLWLNSFRRLDYVGTALGFEQTGLDLPTRQWWPTHSNYWADVRVARTVLAGLERVQPVGTRVDAARSVEEPVAAAPVTLQTATSRLALAGGALLAAAAASAVLWIAVPGVHEMFARPGLEIRMPIDTRATVRHERGFTGDLARTHAFTFQFRDESAGREQRIVALVPGVFGIWSDPRFDYVALARHVRADCVAERARRFFEFGWSAPCTRGDVSIIFDQSVPSRFRVVGFEYSPGLLARGVRLVLSAIVAVFGLLTSCVLTLLAGATFVRLFAFFAGARGNPLASR